MVGAKRWICSGKKKADSKLWNAPTCSPVSLCTAVQMLNPGKIA